MDFLEGILLGSTLGAMATFVFGTAKGKKNQKEMDHKYKTLGKKVEKFRDKLEVAKKSPAGKKVRKVIRKAAKTVVKGRAPKGASKVVGGMSDSSR